jgi:DNA invertase Pin-like site-specific DNA recombinase
MTAKTPTFLPTAKHGRPRIAKEVETTVRRMVLRGASTSEVIEKTKIGGATLTRIRNEMRAEVESARKDAMQEILTALRAGGMKRDRAIDLLFNVTGIRLP